MKTLVIAAALFASPIASIGPAAQTSSAPQAATVYSDTLANGWQNWPWDGAVTEVSVDLKGSARKPILVEAQGYKGLFLHHPGFDTKPFKGLTFLIQSIGTGGQIRVIGLVGGKPIEGRQKLVKLAPGGWTQVDIPLTDLGAAGATIDGLWFQNDSGDPSPRFYVTEIKFH